MEEVVDCDCSICSCRKCNEGCHKCKKQEEALNFYEKGAGFVDMGMKI